uniref:Dynein light chain, cytoplasmic n=2 Tax=Cajanus cajan TaxID=3821 RepID=A0A151SAF5_CAJCA|nr:Dynein light chain, cytoplasmic [Cajanus cajan]
MTTSAIVTVPAKKTHKEHPKRACLELERRKLDEPTEKGVVEVEKTRTRNPHLEKHDDDVAERMSVSVSMSLAPGGGRRRSFRGSQADLRDVFAINGAKMVSVDMPPFMQIHAVDCARKALDSMEKFTSKTLALSLKKEFDGVYGPAWHCIVGTSFGSFVTHSVGGFLYFSMDQKLYILLFKTAVQKAGST